MTTSDYADLKKSSIGFAVLVSIEVLFLALGLGQTLVWVMAGCIVVSGFGVIVALFRALGLGSKNMNDLHTDDVRDLKKSCISFTVLVGVGVLFRTLDLAGCGKSSHPGGNR